MRSKEKILKDFKICHLDDLNCTGCSYYCDGDCTDGIQKSLEKEVVELLENSKSYEDGMNDAWNVAKKFYEMTPTDSKDCFDVIGIFKDVIQKFTAQQAKDAISAWENDKKIRVGDIITANDSDTKCIVVDMDDYNLYTLNENGKFDVILTVDAKKTGKQINVDYFIKQIK